MSSTLHIGGAEQIAAWLAEHVSRDAFDTSACYLKEPGLIADQMSRNGVDLVPIPGLRPGKRDYLTFIKLRQLVREHGIQLIHTHDLHGMIDGAACRLTTPGLRFLHTFHFGNYPNRKWRHKLMEGALWRCADALVAVGYSQMAAIRNLYRIPENRIQVIWNGVDEPTATDKDLVLNWSIPPGIPVIASISTLIPQKGLEYLLEAAAMLKTCGERFALLIVGDGGLRQSLLARAESLGLRDHVQFLGWVPQASSRVFPACDIFVQSSLWEAASVVVLEAMAATKPMVVTAVGENPRVVVHGQTGLIAPPANAQALADGLRTLLRNPSLRARIGQGARQRYEQHFTVKHMISAYERLYGEVLSNAK